MKTTYNPNAIENTWYQHWEQQGYFAPAGEGHPYTIMIPPPNVTGSLHMGHAFQQSIMDALIRYQRMKGRKTLWQTGTDHAGIATQMVVERKLSAEENKTRHDLGREGFIRKVWEWKAESGGTITEQMRRLGNSVDWQTECFTMDKGMTKAVTTAFVQLYREGLAYRGKRLVNWDPGLHTAISDLEVENRDKQGHMWYLRYPLANGAVTTDNKGYIVVATTRPETILGDCAVAVHPDDKRYKSLIGQMVQLPLTNRIIPVISDDYVDSALGTGCVKITPAHDFNDYEMGKRHRLPLINIMTKDATIRQQAEAFNIDGSVCQDIDTNIPEDIHGLNRFEARKHIIAAFKEQNLLEKIDDHALKIPFCERSGEVIEPLLTDQWFIKTKPLAEPAINAVKNGQIKFVPQQYENMYFSWMQDIQDWCVSRQLWWGHRIPAWYDDNGNVYVADTEKEAREHYQLDNNINLRQDDDVFDTWFSSALWTFGTLGWPEKTERLAAFHPTDVLVTGFDIIFFWVARMIMMSLHFLKDGEGNAQIPFKHIYMHGLIRDEQGKKMSKSKGNVLDPLDMIDGIDLQSLLGKRTSNMMQPHLAEKISQRTKKQFPDGINAHGADALRYTLYSLASTGRDLNWDMNRLEGYRNFCNKIWNAARYVFMHTEQYDCGQNGEILTFNLADRWIFSRLQQTISSVEKAMNNFRLDHATQAIYEFIWNEYCDWYLEFSKPVLWDENASEEQLRSTRYTLINVLESALRLAHPFMPFITEEIWQKTKLLTGTTGDSIMLQAYPEKDNKLIDHMVESDIAWIQKIIGAVRAVRRNMNIPQGKELQLLLRNHTVEEEQLLTTDNTNLLKKIAKISSVNLIKNSSPPLCTTQLVGTLEVMVPMADFIDKTAESSRLSKEIEKIDSMIKGLTAKLANSHFIQRAPADVVEKEKSKLHKAQAAIKQLKKQIEEIEKL